MALSYIWYALTSSRNRQIGTELVQAASGQLVSYEEAHQLSTPYRPSTAKKLSSVWPLEPQPSDYLHGKNALSMPQLFGHTTLKHCWLASKCTVTARAPRLGVGCRTSHWQKEPMARTQRSKSKANLRKIEILLAAYPVVDKCHATYRRRLHIQS